MAPAPPRRPIRWWQWTRWPDMLRFVGWIYLWPWFALAAVAATSCLLWLLTR